MRESICGGDEDLVKKMVNCFLEEGEKLLQSLECAIVAQDSKMLHYYAHSLKFSAAAFGAKQLTQLCQELETEGGRSNNSEVAPETAIALRTAFTEITVDFPTCLPLLSTISPGVSRTCFCQSSSSNFIFNLFFYLFTFKFSNFFFTSF